MRIPPKEGMMRLYDVSKIHPKTFKESTKAPKKIKRIQKVDCEVVKKWFISVSPLPLLFSPSMSEYPDHDHDHCHARRGVDANKKRQQQEMAQCGLFALTWTYKWS